MEQETVEFRLESGECTVVIIADASEMTEHELDEMFCRFKVAIGFSPKQKSETPRSS